MMWSVTRSPEEAAAVIGGVGGGTSATHGREIYDFVSEHGSRSSLELGFAWGVGSVYIASALEAAGHGHLTSVDLASEHLRAAEGRQLLRRAGIEHRVDVVLEEGGYNWFLHGKLKEQTSGDRIEPLYDFVFLDGAHTWLEDGLALLLVERLLMPGGWIHFDDIAWLPTDRGDLTEEQRSFPHVRDIWDLLVVPNPAFDEMRVDRYTAWARKARTADGSRVVYKQDLAGSVHLLVGYARTAIRTRR